MIEDVGCAVCGTSYEQARSSANTAGVAFCMGIGSATGNLWLCWRCIRGKLSGSENGSYQTVTWNQAVLK